MWYVIYIYILFIYIYYSIHINRYRLEVSPSQNARNGTLPMLVWSSWLSQLLSGEDCLYTCVCMFISMILPTHPGKLPQSPTQKEIPNHKLLVKLMGAHLPGGPVGEILDYTMYIACTGSWFLPPFHQQLIEGKEGDLLENEPLYFMPLVHPQQFLYTVIIM